MTGPIPPPGPHGGDGARIAAALGVDPDDVLDLSASLNPFAPDVTALARRHLSALRRYPDTDLAERQLAAAIAVPAERLVLTGGGAQAIALLAALLGVGWVDEPEFSLYRRHLPRLDPATPRWRSDPHNPTGTLADLGVVDTGVAVWDEAFLPLSAGVWTRHRPGWAVGSLTKAFASPGLRLGYAIAPTADDARRLRGHRPAWAAGGLACAVLPDLLSHADPPGWTQRIRTARGQLARVLQRHGYRPLPSDGPWLLVPDAAGLRDRLARNMVVVRDCGSFGLDDHVRIAVPDAAGLEWLEDALLAAGGHDGNSG